MTETLLMTTVALNLTEVSDNDLLDADRHGIVVDKDCGDMQIERKNANSRLIIRLNSMLDELKKANEGKEDESFRYRMVRKEMIQFERLYKRWLQSDTACINWDKIELVKDEEFVPYSSIGEIDLNDTANIQRRLSKLAVIKLNGGLGTSMGCTGPKSIINVRDGLTFLDITMKQLEQLNHKYDSDVPLILMNSFYTDADTQTVLMKYQHYRTRIFTFEQSRFPRIDKENGLPIAANAETNRQTDSFKIHQKKRNPLQTSLIGHNDERNKEWWYPPGHGDLYQSLNDSKLLDCLMENGREYVFVSNIDNLGATVDMKILQWLVDNDDENKPEFVMEVTNKTRSDVKGGTLIKYENKLRLLEIAQVPSDKVDEFKSVSKFKIFNTNNLWINLKAIKTRIENNQLDMEVIVNPKTTGDGRNIIQLEMAIGAAIKSFKNARGINVPRSRFLPVKTTSDLLVVMSNLYRMDEHGHLKMNEKRSYPSIPVVKLGSQFKQISDYLRRFGGKPPDSLELDHLTVSGDVNFDKDVKFRGTVIVIANPGSRIDIPREACLENCIVCGNLRILDH
ncbi:hypothetical protein SNEBB_004381 [Seison nebaliae]|nr:hypothetical protein SNEBB_004381 [Seison nebaliae]